MHNTELVYENMYGMRVIEDVFNRKDVNEIERTVIGQGISEVDADSAIRNMDFIKKLYGREENKYLFQMEIAVNNTIDTDVLLISGSIRQLLIERGFQNCIVLKKYSGYTAIQIVVNSINIRTARHISNMNRLRNDINNLLKTYYRDL